MAEPDPNAEFAHALLSLGKGEHFSKEDLDGELAAFDWVDGLEEKDGKVSVNELALAFKHLRIHEPASAEALEAQMAGLQRELIKTTYLLTGYGLAAFLSGLAAMVAVMYAAHARGYGVLAWVGLGVLAYSVGSSAVGLLFWARRRKLQVRMIEARGKMLDDLNAAFANLPSA